MTTFLKRSGAALLSLVLLCVLAMGAGAASSQTVGVKFWKERSDKESMANSGIDADRTATLTRQANGTYTLTLPLKQVSKMGVTGSLSGLTIGDVTYDGTLTGDFEKSTASLTIKNLPASVLTGSDVNKSITVPHIEPCGSTFLLLQVHLPFHKAADHLIQLGHGVFCAFGQLAGGPLDLTRVLVHGHDAGGSQRRTCRHAQQQAAACTLSVFISHKNFSFRSLHFWPLRVVFPSKEHTIRFFCPAKCGILYHTLIHRV